MWNSRSLSVWQDRYRTLSRREQWVVTAGLAAVLVFLLIQFVFFPTNDRLNQLSGSVKTKEKDLSELKTIVGQYRLLEAGRDETGKEKGESFNLFAVLEKLATESGLLDKIEYMKPGTQQVDPLREEKWVEVKLSRITLKDLTSYLYGLQSSGRGIYIKRLSARKDGEYLSLVLQPAVTETKHPGA